MLEVEEKKSGTIIHRCRSPVENGSNGVKGTRGGSHIRLIDLFRVLATLIHIHTAVSTQVSYKGKEQYNPSKQNESSDPIWQYVLDGDPTYLL